MLPWPKEPQGAGGKAASLTYRPGREKRPRRSARRPAYIGRLEFVFRPSVRERGILAQLLAHLDDADIRRYVAGAVNPETERHVRVCVCCALRLADAAQLAVWWERRGPLGRLVRVEISDVVEELLAEVGQEQRPDAA
jgi:hypothetical protein